MQLILLKEGDENISVIEVPDDDNDGNCLAQMVQVELSIPVDEQQLEHEGTVITDEHPLLAFGIVDGSTITVKRVKKAKISIYSVPNTIKPDELLALAQAHPHLIEQYRSHDKDLADILISGDLVRLRTFMMKRQMSGLKMDYTRKQEVLAYEADPNNPELREKMEERKRLAEVQANMEAALENLPEGFGRVIMLYVNIEVNGLPIKAFVDSGAQSTIMSKSCAERCGITRLMDTRFAGTAVGVGSAKILGRVHIAQMKFGNSHFPISITILESEGVDFLFGLDTLKRYRCCIDLGNNCLRIEGSSGVEEVSFLPENELPASARGHVIGPDGSVDVTGGGGGNAKSDKKGV